MARRGRRHGGMAGAPRRRTVWATCRHKGYTCIVISLVIWIIVGVAAWFLISDKLFLLDEGVLDQYTRETNMEHRWKRTMIIAIEQLLLMVWPMCEYLFVFRRTTQNTDRYYWHVPFICMICVSLIVIIAVNGMTHTIGWLTLVQILATLAVISIPRFLFQPR